MDDKSPPSRLFGFHAPIGIEEGIEANANANRLSESYQNGAVVRYQLTDGGSDGGVCVGTGSVCWDWECVLGLGVCVGTGSDSESVDVRQRVYEYIREKL
jgi:hypothetical protein